jgi:hypothetical protein
MNIDSGSYYKITAKSSGKCLDVTGGSNAVADNGARLQQWDYLGGDNQKWRVQNADGAVVIIAENSGKCLDVRGGTGAAVNGVQIQQWDFLNTDNQKWELAAVEAVSAGPVLPIRASQEDAFGGGSGGHMQTDITIMSSGALDAVTHTWEDTQLHGFVGAVAVALLDADKNKLWVSPTQRYGVDGKMVGRSDRLDNSTANVPTELLSMVRYIAIIQKWDPNNVFTDIQNWLTGLDSIAAELGPIIKLVQTIAGSSGTAPSGS